MYIHLIAIGGAIMHNLAIDLQAMGHKITGSDDDIRNPSATRLKKYKLHPEELGWFPEKINNQIDLIILGMHARKDNTELLKANEMGLKVMSFPEFVANKSIDKTRVVIAGSHGKTSTTAMIMHILKSAKINFDYLVGSQVDGFEKMVRISDASIIIIEGDEYLSSSIDLRPKFVHYKPNISILTGIAWDHINVFPTYKSYLKAFIDYTDTFESDTKCFYYQNDEELIKILKHSKGVWLGYEAIKYRMNGDGSYSVRDSKSKAYPIQIFGMHNLENLSAAVQVCKELGVNEKLIFSSLDSFKGAARRLEIIYQASDRIAFLDFAHSPSKIKSTIKACKSRFFGRKLIAIYELHTFSSLNADFLKEYQSAFGKAEEAIVFFDRNTLVTKRMPILDSNAIRNGFQRQDLKVFTEKHELIDYLTTLSYENSVLLMMSSGSFGGIQINDLAQTLLK